MNDYALRAAQEDWEQGIAMLVTMGVLVVAEDGSLVAAAGGAWRFIGPINRIPTGELDEDGAEVLGPVVDGDGRTYWHANLMTPYSLSELAAAAAVDHPEIGEALADLSRWVVTDGEGVHRLPDNPVERIWR